MNAREAAWVALAQAIALLSMYVFITIATLRILWKVWGRRRNVASHITPTLTIHLGSWCFAGFVGTVWAGYLVVFWQLDAPYAAVPFYWTNVTNLAVILGVVKAAIFLTIDRVCAITMSPNNYNGFKRILGWCSFITVIITIIGNMIFVVIAGQSPPRENLCWTLRCSSIPLIVTYFIVYRYIALVIYAIAAVTCLYWLRRYNSAKNILTIHSNTMKLGENIVKFTIYSMFLFGMVPLLASLISANVFQFPLETYVGMFTRVFVAVDGTFVAWKYNSSLAKISPTPQPSKNGGTITIPTRN